MPPEVEQAIDKRSSMAAVGNLNDYVKYQMAQGIEPTGGGGAGGIGAEIADGHGDGAADDEPAGRHHGAGARRAFRPGRARDAGRAAPIDLMTPAQVAQMLGVAESDVIASLEAGDLKGKRIGTQWRVTRAAVDAFLNG